MGLRDFALGAGSRSVRDSLARGSTEVSESQRKPGFRTFHSPRHSPDGEPVEARGSLDPLLGGVSGLNRLRPGGEHAVSIWRFMLVAESGGIDNELRANWLAQPPSSPFPVKALKPLVGTESTRTADLLGAIHEGRLMGSREERPIPAPFQTRARGPCDRHMQGMQRDEGSQVLLARIA
jgi:hypothetical protein